MQQRVSFFRSHTSYFLHRVAQRDQVQFHLSRYHKWHLSTLFLPLLFLYYSLFFLLWLFFIVFFAFLVILNEIGVFLWELTIFVCSHSDLVTIKVEIFRLVLLFQLLIVLLSLLLHLFVVIQGVCHLFQNARFGLFHTRADRTQIQIPDGVDYLSHDNWL